MKVCSKGPIDNDLTLVQVMTCIATGDKPLPEPIVTKFTNVNFTRGQSMKSHWGQVSRISKHTVIGQTIV